MTLTLEQLKSDYSDWPYVFNYANGTGAKPAAAAPGMEVPLDCFDRGDVALIEAAVEGENAGPPWVMWGQLNDGRWFAIKAGCDYTGWG